MATIATDDGMFDDLAVVWWYPVSEGMFSPIPFVTLF